MGYYEEAEAKNQRKLKTYEFQNGVKELGKKIKEWERKKAAKELEKAEEENSKPINMF